MNGVTTTRVTAPAGSGTDRSVQRYRVLACVCAVIAGAVHALVVPEHLAESAYVGFFFVVVSAGQFGIALALRVTTATVLLVGAIAANLAIATLYVASRTVELPLLPAHEHAEHAVTHLPVAGAVGNGIPVYPETHIEPVGPWDMLCLLAELVLVLALVGMLRGRAQRIVANVMLGMALLALGARVTGLLA